MYCSRQTIAARLSEVCQAVVIEFALSLYHFVDQPGLPEKFYKEFKDQIDDEYDWIQPTYKNEKGHPLLLHKSIFNSILELTDDSSLKEISKNNEVKKKLWDCTHKEIFQDIDYPSDLKQA